MKKYKTRLREEHTVVLIGLILGIFLIWIFSKNILNSYGICIINDEFGYWGIAASWNGKDWTELLSDTPYYSFGYSLLIVGLYRLLSSTELVYQCALWINVALILGSFWISYLCGRKIMPQFSRIVTLFICFLITIYSNNIVQAQVAWTETLLYFLFWLSVYLIIRLIQKPTIVKVIFYSVLNVYMYYVHQRTLGILVSSLLIVIILLLGRKISFSLFACYIGSFIALFFVGNLIKNDIITTLFTSKELVALNNYSGQTAKLESILTSPEGFLLLLESILGKLFYLGVSTFLFAYIALGHMIVNCISDLIVVIKAGFYHIKDRTIVAAYLLLAFSSTFLIAAVAMYLPYGRLDLLIYGRYMEMCIGPILFYGISLLFANKVEKKWVVIYITILLILSSVVNFVFLDLNTTDINAICVVVVSYFFEMADQLNGIPYWIAIVSVSLILILTIFGKKTRKILMFLLFSLIGLFWIELSNYTGVDRLQNSIISNIGIYMDNISKLNAEYSLYIVDGAESSDQYSKYIQYWLPDNSIKKISFSDINNVKKENSIIIIPKEHKKISDIYGEFYVLDKNDGFLLFTDKDNYELIQQWESIEKE